MNCSTKILNFISFNVKKYKKIIVREIGNEVGGKRMIIFQKIMHSILNLLT